MNSHLQPFRVYAAWSEKPLAFICVGLAATTLVWKTIGLGFVPGWEEMFGGVGAQYPRRPQVLTPSWRLGYLAVYGVLGTAATFAGLLITLRRGDVSAMAGSQVRMLAVIHGLFHTLIGLHHTAWALTRGGWGHLSLEQFDVPGLYLLGALGGAGAGIHGLRLLTCASTDSTHRIVRSKIAVDGVSLLTFTSIFVCWPLSAFGVARNPELERISWVLVFLGPVLWLLADLVCTREARPTDPAGS
ncbi:MAG: hypothetical protein AAFX94_17315 [Myxococcota bacterium]